MIFNKHSNLIGKHSYLSASQHSWLNYDENKLLEAYDRRMASIRGTELHDFAARCIELRQKLPKSRKTLNMYVNDAIGYRMSAEVPLYYSDNAFGTADAICFRNGFLRIHDLKTGRGPTHMEQLMIYAAYFCLEYKMKPGDLQTELRIYQNDDILICNPSASDILPIMDKIKTFDKILNDRKKEDEWWIFQIVTIF